MPEEVQTSNDGGSNERVALDSMNFIHGRIYDEPKTRKEIIDLYVDCYRATFGERMDG